MYQRALLSYTKASYPNTKPKLDLLYNMGLFYRKMQDFDKAKGFFNQAYEGHQRLLGSQHTETIDALEQLNIEIERSMQGAESSKSGKINAEEPRGVEDERSTQGAEGFKSRRSRFSPARLWRRRHWTRDP